MNVVKTTMLLTVMTMLFMLVGYLLAGQTGMLIAIIGGIACLYIASPDIAGTRTQQELQTDDTGPYSYDSYDLKWYKYSPELLSQLQARNKAIFVDFTASWCVTCQFNKRMVFSSEEVRAELLAKGVILVRADWTRKDPAQP